MRSFEDAVIFVFDIEKCLKRLDPVHQELIARVALQEYKQGETAALMGMSLRSVVRRYGEALDRLTEVFLSVKLLTIPGLGLCQEGGRNR
jgi:DNA-directed RNA polymerase specialized sigma24 family protein